ncbi:MAG TPA: carboxypeptidase-like regulatory domain-containing protein [Pyrinomonadaceae bacterium]|nr:carboxypeptidase-like regulatory domain-containing protein [Pyrinomonadaceae bacterium]
MLAAFAGGALAHSTTTVDVVSERGSTFGTIRGVVRDDGGNPIADATVAIFKAGTQALLKQVVSGRDGSFVARILPGTYTVLAVAEGFNPVTLFGIEVSRAADLSYGFKLERAGSGNTLPEKRADKNSSKWRIRAAQTARSIYQNQPGSAPATQPAADAEADDRQVDRKGETVVETYFADGPEGSFKGVNFATLLPLGEDSELVIAAQMGKGANAPQRFETAFRFQPAADHNVRVTASAGRLGTLRGSDATLGQLTGTATDEWHLKNGAILVLGFDYSKFIGGGSDQSFAPRFGFQFDIDPKTRFRTAVTTQTTEQRSWSQVAEFEGDQSFSFTEPVAVPDLVLVGGKARMNKSRRVEFGVERILDNASSIEANAFLDSTFGRGVGLDVVGMNGVIDDMVADQRGTSRGIRVVYQRRLPGPFTASAGYSFGGGQKLSPNAVTDPSHAFESGFFQSFFAQLAASFKSGTNVRTVFRLSPQATVFAIDPFKGRLAIYDPGLSVFVTQSLPTFGMPFRAEAIVDGRNLLDTAAGVGGEEGSLIFAGQRRMVRGGIQVRF